MALKIWLVPAKLVPVRLMARLCAGYTVKLTLNGVAELVREPDGFVPTNVTLYVPTALKARQPGGVGLPGWVAVLVSVPSVVLAVPKFQR